jgi:hypothetical protein
MHQAAKNQEQGRIGQQKVRREQNYPQIKTSQNGKYFKAEIPVELQSLQQRMPQGKC